MLQVQSGKLKTSYAVPPQSSFTCEPWSVRYATVEGKYVRRSYCALGAPEAQVWCFSEKDDRLSEKFQLSTSKWLSDDPSNPIVFLDALQDSAREGSLTEPDLLVMHRNGRVRRISSNLDHEHWSLSCVPMKSSGPKPQVIAASIVNSHEAEPRLFKRRPDIASDLASSLRESSESTTILLCVIREANREGNSRSDVYFEAYMLPRPTEPSIRAGIVETKRLLRSEFPKDHDRWSLKANAKINIDPTFWSVDVAFEKGIVTYDMVGYSADIDSQLVLDSEVFSSCMRLSSTLTIAASSSAITLYDAKYGSVLHKIPMDQVRLNRKRKRTTGQVMEEPVEFVDFFRHLGMLVARRGNSLLSFEIGPELTSYESRNSRKLSGLLISAVGRGLKSTIKQDMKKPKDIGPGFGNAIMYKNQDATERWNSRKDFLSKLIDSGATERFEQEIASDLFGIAAQKRPLEDLYQSYTTEVADPEKVRYILSKMFIHTPPDLEQSELPSLRLRIEAHHLLQWLMKGDWISQASIASALNKDGVSSTHQIYPVGSVHGAFEKADPSLRLLTKLLDISNSLEAAELTSIVQQHVMVALDLQEESLQNNLLAGPDSAELVNDSEQFEKALDKIGDSSPQNQSVVQKRSLVLNALERLHSKPRTEVISMARSHLRGDSLLALVQLLRQQLFHGGYTTSFRSQPLLSPPASPTINGEKEQFRAQRILGLDVIVNLLSCCIDALGSVSVLSGSSDHAFMEPLIADLRSEISSALQGVEEAAYLQGILREVWRYGASATSTSSEASDRIPSDPEQRPSSGEIVTLVSQSTEDQFDGAGTMGMLPLSLKMEAGVSDYKVRRGGGQVLQRSQREKAGLQHRAVGRYSFERLIL